MPETTTAPARALTPAAQVCLVVVAASSIVGLATLADPVLAGVAVLLLGLGLAWGWAGALGLPSPYGTAGVLAASSVVMVTVVLADRSTAMTWLPAAMGASVLLTFLHQLLRRDGRPRLVESASATLLGLAIIGSGVMFIPLALSPEKATLAFAATSAAAVSAAVDLIGRWPAARPWAVPVGLVASGLAAVAVGLTGETSWTIYLLVGMAAAALGHAVRAVLSVVPTMAQVRPRVVSAIASVLLSGGVVYAIVALTTDLIPL